MTRKQALTDLLAKVDAGRVEGPDFMGVCVALGFKREFVYTWKEAQESLDAAKALHEAVLPNMKWSITPSLGRMRVGVWEEVLSNSSKHENPARAWLIAIIKALIAEETQ